jgi:hypothetical protein
MDNDTIPWKLHRYMPSNIYTSILLLAVWTRKIDIFQPSQWVFFNAAQRHAMQETTGSQSKYSVRVPNETTPERYAWAYKDCQSSLANALNQTDATSFSSFPFHPCVCHYLMLVQALAPALVN